MSLNYSLILFVLKPIVDRVAHYAFDREEIEDFLSSFYELPIFWANLRREPELMDVAQGSLRLMSVGIGYSFVDVAERSRPSQIPFLSPTVSYSFTRTPDFYHTVSTTVNYEEDNMSNDVQAPWHP